jgi:cytoskeletal protein CcmA (bactofilin family)
MAQAAATGGAGAAKGGVLGAGASLIGKIRGQDLKVLGSLEGELHLEGTLHVGPQGRVAARVRAGAVVVEGEIEGDVRAASLTLGETARARGTFVAKRLLVKEGAVVEGSINPQAPSSMATVQAPLSSEYKDTPEPPDAGPSV